MSAPPPFRSGREELPLADRVGLLKAWILDVQLHGPKWDGHNGRVIHDLNALIGNVQGIVNHPEDSWSRANLSKTEARCMAWTRGGYEEMKRVTEELYPPYRGKYPVDGVPK